MSIWRVPYPKFGGGIGLHRVAAIAERLGIDLAAFGAAGAVITGSNGKGSTAAMCASMLRESGAHVGRFTSPHLFALNERFWLNGEDIPDDALAHHWERVRAAAQNYLAGRDETLGGFEFLFLIAADWFAARRCDFTVWEAGIGGRYDPTRLIRPRRAALTALDLEHTALLGGTLQEIAYDKLDVAPEGAAMFIGASCAPLRDEIAFYCALGNVTAHFTGVFDADTPLYGVHQQENAALAIALATSMGALSDEDVARGLAATRWPGRLEVLSRDPLTVIDVGHTPGAIAAAKTGFEALRGARRGVLVCGCSVDKDAEGVISALAPGFETIVCAAARHKGRPPAEIAALAVRAAPDADIVLAEDVAEARKLALAKAQGGAAIYVAGGLFLAAEFKAVHLGRDPASLAFF